MDHSDTSQNSKLVGSEHKIDETIARVWKWKNFWIPIFLMIIIAEIPFPSFLIYLGPVLTIASIWFGSYLIRQRWKLILTNQQIIARQLFPRPLTFFLLMRTTFH